MRTLPIVKPKGDQLPLVQKNEPGTVLIRGAAGSGKTSIALLRLRFLLRAWQERRRRLQLADPVRVLVLTYNKTLRGYVQQLVDEQVEDHDGVDLEVSTFLQWAYARVGRVDPVDEMFADSLAPYGARTDHLKWQRAEIEYVLGRYLPEDIDTYVTAKREGRSKPPNAKTYGEQARRAFLDNVVLKYRALKQTTGDVDWNDVAVMLAKKRYGKPHDVVIVDEAQDFHANWVRAIRRHVADPHSLTFVLDAAQRIYPRHFTWSEVGIDVTKHAVFRLKTNHRNTREIAALAKSLLHTDATNLGEDATLPDLDTCTRTGRRPEIVLGKFAAQMQYAIEYITNNVDLTQQSVAFLHPLGGGWFKYVRAQLEAAGLPYVELSSNNEWPDGPENIGLSTLHSGKGLEFDFVFLLGLDNETLPDQSDDMEQARFRRLVAMGITRAREGVVLGHRPDAPSEMFKLLDPATFDEVRR